MSRHNYTNPAFCQQSEFYPNTSSGGVPTKSPVKTRIRQQPTNNLNQPPKVGPKPQVNLNTRFIDNQSRNTSTTNSRYEHLSTSIPSNTNNESVGYALVPLSEIPNANKGRYACIPGLDAQKLHQNTTRFTRSQDDLDRYSSLPATVNENDDSFTSLPPCPTQDNSRLKSAFSSYFGNKSLILVDQNSQQRYAIVPTEEDEELVDANHEIIQMHNGISGGPLNGDYEFAQLHFHWGDNDTVGSEDLIDGRSFPMELHMVFYNKQYLDAQNAMKHSDGLCVLAFFYDVDDKNNENYNEFSEVLSHVVHPETSATFNRPPSLFELMPKDLEHYFTYNGSLTTPPCSEIVTWIDFQQPIGLSHNQIFYLQQNIVRLYNLRLLIEGEVTVKEIAEAINDITRKDNANETADLFAKLGYGRRRSSVLRDRELEAAAAELGDRII